MMKTIIIAQTVWRETLRRKDLYVLIALLLAFFLTLISLNVFGLRGLVGYVKELGLLLVWIFSWFLTIGISARQLPQEEKSGTIFSLLAKPVGRAELIIGKWLGAWSVAGAATLCFYLILAGIVLARGGILNPLLTAEAWLLHCGFIGVLAALAILFSTRLNSDAAATMAAILSGAAFLVLPQTPRLVGAASGWSRDGLLIIYYSLPHLEIFDLRQRLAQDWPALAWRPGLMIMAYGLLLVAIFLALGWLAYRRKKFYRDVF